MNVTGSSHHKSEQIRRNLIAQVTRPVRWELCVRTMLSQGVELFIEIGPGRTLAGLNKRIGVPAPTISVGKVEDLEKLHKALAVEAEKR